MCIRDSDKADHIISSSIPAAKAWFSHKKLPKSLLFSFLFPFSAISITVSYTHLDVYKRQVENGITEGTSDTTFAPGTICTRAQGAALLYRAAGSPAVSGSAAFTDVPADAYYADAAAWAEQKGITDGIGNGLFGPHNNCTRAQIVTFLYRLYGSK